MFDHGQTALSDAYRRSCIQRRDVKLDRRRLTSRALSRMLNRGDHGISPATVSGCRSTRIRRRLPEPSRWSRSASIFRSQGRVSRAANSTLIPSGSCTDRIARPNAGSSVTTPWPTPAASSRALAAWSSSTVSTNRLTWSSPTRLGSKRSRRSHRPEAQGLTAEGERAATVGA